MLVSRCPPQQEGFPLARCKDHIHQIHYFRHRISAGRPRPDRTDGFAGARRLSKWRLKRSHGQEASRTQKLAISVNNAGFGAEVAKRVAE